MIGFRGINTPRAWRVYLCLRSRSYLWFGTLKLKHSEHISRIKHNTCTASAPWHLFQVSRYACTAEIEQHNFQMSSFRVVHANRTDLVPTTLQITINESSSGSVANNLPTQHAQGVVINNNKPSQMCASPSNSYIKNSEVHTVLTPFRNPGGLLPVVYPRLTNTHSECRCHSKCADFTATEWWLHLPRLRWTLYFHHSSDRWH